LFCSYANGWLHYYIWLHVTTCYYMLLHVTTCYYMLLHVTTCYYMLLHVTTCYYMLLLVTTCYYMLLHATTCYYMRHMTTLIWLHINVVTHEIYRFLKPSYLYTLNYDNKSGFINFIIG
jgi:hypothetical protein